MSLLQLQASCTSFSFWSVWVHPLWGRALCLYYPVVEFHSSLTLRPGPGSQYPLYWQCLLSSSTCGSSLQESVTSGEYSDRTAFLKQSMVYFIVGTKYLKTTNGWHGFSIFPKDLLFPPGGNLAPPNRCRVSSAGSPEKLPHPLEKMFFFKNLPVILISLCVRRPFPILVLSLNNPLVLLSDGLVWAIPFPSCLFSP